MLVIPNACATCGAQVGSVVLLYLQQRNAKYAGKRPDAYTASSFKDLADATGLTNACCWQLCHGVLTHADQNLGIKLVLDDGTVVQGTA